MIDDLQERFQFNGMTDAVVGIDPKVRKLQLQEMMKDAPVTRKTKHKFIVPKYASKFKISIIFY